MIDTVPGLIETIIEGLAMLGIWLGLSFWCYATYPTPAWWQGCIVGLVAFIAIDTRLMYRLHREIR